MDARIKSVEFDFDLPPERIAQRPRPIEEQRLLVFDRKNNAIAHHYFVELPSLLRPGDVIVVNDSRVVPAALRQENGNFILFTNPMNNALTDIKAICPWKPKVGEHLKFDRATFAVKEHEPGWDIYIGDLITEESFSSLREFLERHGHIPIPIYVIREPDKRDEKDFQTVFAKHPGSIAAPTASLHFTEKIIAELRNNGVEVVEITLHVGYGTFRSFKTEYVDEHKMDKEEYHVPLSSLRKIGKALKEKRRIIAVGTTSTRTLEAIAHQIKDYELVDRDLFGSTDIFIYPPYDFKVISGLLTNFHYPKIPVMSLTCAFCGLSELKQVYQIALTHDYLFYSYGDAMLAL